MKRKHRNMMTAKAAIMAAGTTIHFDMRVSLLTVPVLGMKER